MISANMCEQAVFMRIVRDTCNIPNRKTFIPLLIIWSGIIALELSYSETQEKWKKNRKALKREEKKESDVRRAFQRHSFASSFDSYVFIGNKEFV